VIPTDRATPIEGEKATIGVDELAKILRTNAAANRRPIRMPDFPMPPANPRPLRWTAGQIERFLSEPQDHNEHNTQCDGQVLANVADYTMIRRPASGAALV
jgi:hypothetical protein